MASSLQRTMRLLSSRTTTLRPIRPLALRVPQSQKLYSITPPPPPPAGKPTPPSHLDPAEADIFSVLSEKLSPTALEVQDVSGGCGSMYALSITSEAFRGLSVVKQHRLVNECLKGRVEKWHGLQVRCSVP